MQRTTPRALALVASIAIFVFAVPGFAHDDAPHAAAPARSPGAGAAGSGGARGARPAAGAAGAGSPGAKAAESCPPITETVQRLQARYDATKNFRADFRQETAIASVGQGEEAFGSVVFVKPGRMRWEFQSPQRQSIIADGTTLWIYQPDDRQVLKAAFNAAFVSTTPVSFLAGVGRIKDDFDVEQDTRGCNAQRIYLKLVPKRAQDVGSLTLAVSRPTFDIVEAAITDPVGNVTTLSFSNLQRNVDVPDDEFRFVVPPGVDVVTAPSGAPQ